MSIVIIMAVEGAYFLLSTVGCGENTAVKRLHTVKTTNPRSLFVLQYRFILKDASRQKAFIGEIRCRNGNLDVRLGKAAPWKEELS